MNITVMKETHPGETRVPMVPATVERLVKLGCEVVVESGTGLTCRFDDAAYAAAGATIAASREDLLRTADIVLRLRKPPLAEIPLMRRGAVHVSYLDPFNEVELVDALVAAGISAVSLEMIPRTTLAQKMDVLSSQANLAGYVAVLLGTAHLDKILPMMTTPAGTIKPAKSLGAKFVKVDLGATGQTKDGYATQLTPEQVERQKQGMIKACAQADIVITTAQVFGRPAPRIVDRAMLAQMQPGSVIVDMAVETGGNVEGSELDKVMEIGGVKVVGLGNLPGKVALTASQMYSSNLGNFVAHFWDKETNTFRLNLEDDIIKGALITHDGALFSATYKSIMHK